MAKTSSIVINNTATTIKRARDAPFAPVPREICTTITLYITNKKIPQTIHIMTIIIISHIIKLLGN